MRTLYWASEGETLDDVIAGARELRGDQMQCVGDKIVPALMTVVMPWVMGDGNRQMIGLANLESLRG